MKFNSGRFKKGQVSPRKGVVVSDETRMKMRLAKLGKKRPFTDEHRKNLSIALKGKSKFWLLGKKRVFTDEWRQKIINVGKKRIGIVGKNKGKTWKIDKKYIPKMRERMLGEKNPSYLKDRSLLKRFNDDHKDRRSSAYSAWRKEVWTRDKFQCKIKNESCLGRIEAHHILGWSEYPELRYQINNGITLCHAHHPRKRAEEKRLIPTFKELVSVSN